MSSEGARLRESWSNALKNAQTQLRELLSSSATTATPTSSSTANSSAASIWRAVPVRTSTTASSSSSSSTPTGTTGGVGTRTEQLVKKGKSTKAAPDPSDVIVHRRPSKDGDVYRAVLDVYVPSPGASSSEATKALLSLEAWTAVLATPELRSEYDPVVQDGRIVEMFDPETRIARTDFALGWPANPRDAITIAKSYADTSTLIDICTSLPRSADEPAYLRPAPPFVRSHIHLYAWVIQIFPSQSDSASGSGASTSAKSSSAASTSSSRVRVTCFWQHDLKAIWGIGNSIHQHLPNMLVGLVNTVQTHGSRMPHMRGYGKGVGITHLDFEGPRQLLKLEYSVTGDEDEDDSTTTSSMRSEGLGDGLRALKEFRRLERSVECTLPSGHSWDVRIHSRASSSSLQPPHFVVHASQPVSANSSSSSSSLDEPITLRISHPQPPDHSVLRITVAIEPSASLGSSGKAHPIRVNGSNQTIHRIEPRDPSFLASTSTFEPSATSTSRQILSEATTIGEMPLQSAAMIPSISSSGAISIVSNVSDKTQRTAPGGIHGSGRGGRPGILGVKSSRSAAAEKAITTLVRRNYIYFTSLLQEPEAKWSKPITESRGVTVTQLNSIDPTLVVYKAEAVFVGVGVWDLLSIVSTPGVGVYWNKGHEGAAYLEHVSELTELWHLKNKAAWPVNARDSVQVKTTYKSPTACHVFSFSTDDDKLFPSIPPLEPAVIRTQVDLQGWAIEALSPNTTQLTLLDQSDPKGWSNKSSIPSQMIVALAGMGEFAIKCGGPPIMTRIMGAKVMNSRYDYERHTFRLDYETTPPTSSNGSLDVPNSSRSDTNKTPTNEDPSFDDLTPQAATVDLPSATEDNNSVRSTTSSPTSMTNTPATVECELRCDIDVWANSLDIIVDPAPQTLTCLRRHKLASGGSGLWLTVEHDALKVAEEHITIVVRKGGNASKERGTVLVNGVKIRVDVEDMPEHEAKSLSKKRRIKPTRIPLDQPPVLTVQRPRGGVDDDSESSSGPSTAGSGRWTFVTPITRLFTRGAEPFEPISTTLSSSGSPTTTSSPDTRSPMHYAFEALSRVRELHSQSISDGWTLVSEKDIAVYRKVDARISSKIAIHKAQKIVEGFGAEEIAAVISNDASRMQWDDKLDSVLPLDVYGAGCSTSFIVGKAGFPFRDRGYFVAKLLARIVPSDEERGAIADVRQRTTSMGASANRGRSPTSRSQPPALICITVSFATATPRRYSQQKVNPFTLPVGQLLVEGWVLETLDPYTSQNLAIPSTRCTHITATDLAGQVPMSYNNSYNAAAVRAVLAMERYLKGKLPPPYPLVPAPAILIDEMEDHDLSRSDGQLLSWQLDRLDPTRHLLTSAFSPNDSSYRISILVAPKHTDGMTTQTEGSTIKPAIGTAPPTRPSTPSKQSLSRSNTMNSGTRDSSPGRSSHFRSLSRSSAPFPSSSPSPHPRTMSSSMASRPSLASILMSDPVEEGSSDLVLAEIVLDASLYKNGCDIKMLSKLRPPKDDTNPDTLGFSSIPTTETDIPIQCALHPLPASTLASNSLSSPTKRYILLLTLSIAQYSAPTIRDPLTGSSTPPPARPGWLDAFEERGAILEVQIGASDDRKFVVQVDGNKVSSTPLPTRLQPAGDSAGDWPRLQRIPFDPDADGAMETVLASATHLFEDPSPPAPEETESTVSTIVSPSAETDPSPLDTPPGATTPSTEVLATGILGFLGQYRRGPLPSTPTDSHANNSSYWPTASSLSLPGRWLSRQTSLASIEPAKPPTPSVAPKAPANGDIVVQQVSPSSTRAQSRAGFSLHAVVFIAVIAFLLGSLLRSILSPADFVLINGHFGRGVPEWQEIKRLMHIHAFSRGLVIGIVRRAPP